MGLVEAYVGSVWKHASMHAMYPPDTGVAVGDVFEFKRGVYSRQFRLGDEGVQVETTTTTSGTWESKSEDGTTFDLVVDGKLPDGTPVQGFVDAEVGAVVGLKREGSYVANLAELTKETLEDLRAIKRDIARRFRRNAWDTAWILVTEVWRASETTIIAGSSDATNVTLKAKTGVAPADIELATIATNLSIASRGTASMTFDGVPELSPFFRGYQFSLWDILTAAEAPGARYLGLDEEPAAGDLRMVEWVPGADLTL